MIPLAAHRQVWTWCCVYPIDENSSKWQKFIYIIFTLTIFLAIISVVPVSVAYIIRYMSDDPKGSLHALLQISAYTGISYVAINAFIVRLKIIAIFDGLSNIYEKNSQKHSYGFFVEANDKSNWLWKIYFRCMIIAHINTCITAINTVVACYKEFGHMDEKFLYHPYKVVLPWNCSTPLGYFNEILFNSITGQSYIFINGVIILLFISMCWHHQAFSKMYNRSLGELQYDDKHRNDRRFLCDLIQFQNMTKNWMLESAKAYSLFVPVLLGCLTICISCVFFELDLQYQHPDSDLSILLAAFFFCASSPFVYCFFGIMTTESYIQMADSLFESNWQRLSIDLQKYFILMLGNMHRPLYYHGFGIVILNLETFRNIFRSIITYYMMFKALTLE